jgi:hypothetical protein
MNGFGFVEYDDAMDARDVVPGESPVLTWLICGKASANVDQLTVSSPGEVSTDQNQQLITT